MRTVLITGTNRGIGLELTRQFSARGDHVLACARRPDQADALAALAQEEGRNIELFQMDVADGRSVARGARQIGRRRIDVLVNNAGVIGPDRQSSIEMDFEGWLYTLNVNTLGPVRVLHAFLDNLRAAQQPRVLTLTSYMGSFANAGRDRVAYRSSKAALNRAMQAIAADLADEGMAVAVAHPGWVRTDMGGRSASIEVADSAAGLIRIIDTLDVEKAGHFFNWDGSEYPW